VVAARLVAAVPLPLPVEVMSWVGVLAGIAAGLAASFMVSGVPPVNAVVVGLATTGIGVAIDRLFGPVPDPLRDLSLLARAAAPVAAAGTAAFAVIRIGIG
jgi:hypothetical protein